MPQDERFFVSQNEVSFFYFIAFVPQQKSPPREIPPHCRVHELLSCEGINLLQWTTKVIIYLGSYLLHFAKFHMALQN